MSQPNTEETSADQNEAEDEAVTDGAADDKMMREYDKAALEYCQGLIKWYEDTKTSQRHAYWASQISIIVLSGITPILILVGNIPAILQAIPPAIVTIIIGLSGVFQWKENYLRFAYTSQALKSEKIRFETRSSKEYDRKMDAADALSRFVTRVDIIAMGEMEEWRTLMQEASGSNADE